MRSIIETCYRHFPKAVNASGLSALKDYAGSA